jgi:hypothetical protein
MEVGARRAGWRGWRSLPRLWYAVRAVKRRLVMNDDEMKDRRAMRTAGIAEKGSRVRAGLGRRDAISCCFALRSRRTCLALHEHYHLGHGAHAVRPLHRG